MKKKQYAGILLAEVFVILTGILFCCERQEMPLQEIWQTMDTEYTQDESADESVQPETGRVSAENEQIYVYVCGCVRAPGVYAMEADDRMYEAIEMAGGACEDADLDSLNLAARLTDGEKVYIPVVGERTEQAEEAEVSDSRLNLNTATSEELQTLPGIGQAKAEAILAFREAQGGFSSIEELLQVPGIKEGIYGKIQSLIRVD